MPKCLVACIVVVDDESYITDCKRKIADSIDEGQGVRMLDIDPGTFMVLAPGHTIEVNGMQYAYEAL